MIETRELQYLLCLEEHRHFGRAARALGISQPALTKCIQKLEKKFAALLFDRSRSKVVPTAVGAELIARARQIVGGIVELERSIASVCDFEMGTVSVGVGPAMAESYATEAIAELAQEHPLIEIQVRIDHWEQLRDWLTKGEIDFFLADTAALQSDPFLIMTPLPEEELTWFCRAGHPLANRKRLDRSDLLRYPLVTPRMPAWARQWLGAAAGNREVDPKRPLPNVSCENYSMLKRIVMSSNCISAALATTIRRELSEQQLITLRVDAPTLKTHAGIVQLRDRSPSPLAAKLIELIQVFAEKREVQAVRN